MQAEIVVLLKSIPSADAASQASVHHNKQEEEIPEKEAQEQNKKFKRGFSAFRDCA